MTKGNYRPTSKLLRIGANGFEKPNELNVVRHALRKSKRSQNQLNNLRLLLKDADLILNDFGLRSLPLLE